MQVKKISIYLNIDASFNLLSGGTGLVASKSKNNIEASY